MNARSLSRCSAGSVSFLAMVALLALPILLGTGCVSARYEPAQHTPNDTELGTRLADLATAYETMDVNKITPFYATDGYELSFETPFPFATKKVEHRDVLGELLGKVNSLTVTFAPDFDAWRDGDRAWTTREFTAKGVTKEGTPFTYTGWHSAVWERQNGQWLVWYEHFGGGPKIEQPKVAAVPPPTPTPTPEVAPPPPPKLTDAFFDFDKWNIRADQIATLEQDVQILKDNPDLKVIIEGHCDARGTYPYNDVLGEKRAKSAKAFLMKHGIAADRLETISYGKRRPFELGKGEEIWQANRRAHFTLVK